MLHNKQAVSTLLEAFINHENVYMNPVKIVL